MKRFICILLTLLMTVSLLAGCGGTSNGSASSGGTSSGSAPDGSGEAVSDQLSDILAAGKLVVGVEGTYYPFTYHDEDTNELVGYDVEVAKAVAEYMGVDVEFVETDWDSLLAGLDSKRLDTVINDVSATEERREKYDFSDTYFYSFRQVVVKTGNEVGLHSLEDLNGKKIATNITNSYVETLEELGVEIVPIDNTDQCATMVESGRVDFCMFNTVVLSEYMAQHPDAQLEVAFKIEDSINEIAIPTRKGETRLMEQFNAALSELRENGTLLELSMKYFGADYCNNPLEG